MPFLFWLLFYSPDSFVRYVVLSTKILFSSPLRCHLFILSVLFLMHLCIPPISLYFSQYTFILATWNHWTYFCTNLSFLFFLLGLSCWIKWWESYFSEIISLLVWMKSETICFFMLANPYNLTRYQPQFTKPQITDQLYQTKSTESKFSLRIKPNLFNQLYQSILVKVVFCLLHW